MEKNISTLRVTVYKDEFNFYPDGIKRSIDCVGLRKIATENLNTASTSGGVCSTGIIPGGETGLAGVDSIATVKVRPVNKGDVWILPSDYTALINNCNSCCLS